MNAYGGGGEARILHAGVGRVAAEPGLWNESGCWDWGGVASCQTRQEVSGQKLWCKLFQHTRCLKCNSP